MALLFCVQWRYKTSMSIRQTELVALGFEVVRVGAAMAKVTFESELIYALPKPSGTLVADRSQPSQPTQATP